MTTDIVSFPTRSPVECCECGCSCSLKSGSSIGKWIRSVKRKYDKFEGSDRFYIPGLDFLPIARVGIENECALLRERVINQQSTILKLGLDLEEERKASSSAANEAMSMIWRIQGEKAEVQMEARQFKRFAEEKISHDAWEISSLKNLVYKKEQTIQALTCEVQACKNRMMNYGFIEYEAEGMKGNYGRNTSFYTDLGGDVDSPTYGYPPLRFNLNESQGQSEFEDNVVDIKEYPFGEAPRSQVLEKLAYRINQLEATPPGDQVNGSFGSRPVLEKITAGHSPEWSRHSKNSSGSQLGFSDVGPYYTMDSPRFGTSFTKLDCVAEELGKSDRASKYEDDMSERVYTIDSVHLSAPHNNYVEPKVAAMFWDEYVSTPRGSQTRADVGEPEVKKLYLRLQALEADRKLMRQTITSMQTDKAQMVLLREIAQQLCKDMTPAKWMPVQKPSMIRTFSFFAVYKWMLSFVFWRKTGCQSKYIFVLTANNVGLLMLLDNNCCGRLWRYVTSTQLRK